MTFIGVEVPAAITDWLVGRAKPFCTRPKSRYDVHMTLVHLRDNVPLDTLKEIGTVIRALNDEPLSCSTRRLVELTPLVGNEIAVVCSIDSPSLVRFQSRLRAALRALHIPHSQDYEYTPHITLGFRDEPIQLDCPLNDVSEWEVRKIRVWIDKHTRWVF